MTSKSPGELLVLFVVLAIGLQVGVAIFRPLLPWLVAAVVVVLVVRLALFVRRYW